VIQAVDVFFSPDIEKGAKWGNEIDAALEGTSFGIVVITKDSLASPWLHYEAGALSKLDRARVWTFLLDVTNAEVPPPLGRFQHTEAKRDEVSRMLQSINARLSDFGATPLKDRVLQEVFEDAWPKLEAKLADAASAASQSDAAVVSSEVRPRGRSEREMLEEVLEILRAQERGLEAREMSARTDSFLGGEKYYAYSITAEYEDLWLNMLIAAVRGYLGVEMDYSVLSDGSSSAVVYFSKPVSERGFGAAMTAAIAAVRVTATWRAIPTADAGVMSPHPAIRLASRATIARAGRADASPQPPEAHWAHE
jgi:hypothetical protein